MNLSNCFKLKRFNAAKLVPNIIATNIRERSALSRCWTNCKKHECVTVRDCSTQSKLVLVEHKLSHDLVLDGTKKTTWSTSLQYSLVLWRSTVTSATNLLVTQLQGIHLKNVRFLLLHLLDWPVKILTEIKEVFKSKVEKWR